MASTKRCSISYNITHFITGNEAYIHLASLSIFADLADLAVKSIVTVKDVFVFVKNKPHLKIFKGLSVFFYDIVAVYVFEGILMVLSL